jgi:hypothetical protein
VVNTHGPVEPDKDNIRQEPYTLPQGFTWDALDLGDRGVVSWSLQVGLSTQVLLQDSWKLSQGGLSRLLSVVSWGLLKTPQK